MYILDTSVVRGISREKLISANSKVKIAVSTLTVLELASHLNKDDFSRARGNFIKCNIPQLLHDPFWLLSQRIQSNANPTRKEDKFVLTQLIDAAEQSQTFAEFEAKTLLYPNGDTLSCKDIGEKIDEILKEEEDRFVSHLKNLSDLAKLSPSLNGKHCLQPGILWGQLNTARKLLTSSEDVNLQGNTILATTLYFGYLLHRLYLYANHRPPGEDTLQVNRNDCEDAYICLYLNLQTCDTIVSGDKATLFAIKNTLDLLKEYIQVPKNSNYAMNKEEFLSVIDSL